MFVFGVSQIVFLYFGCLKLYFGSEIELWVSQHVVWMSELNKLCDCAMVSHVDLIISDHIEYNRTFECGITELRASTDFKLITSARVPHVAMQ